MKMLQMKQLFTEIRVICHLKSFRKVKISMMKIELLVVHLI
jgi:hypothetical protein